MPLSVEAQHEEKIIAKQAATDEKVLDQRPVRRDALSLFCTTEPQACDERRRPCGEGRSETCKGLS